MPDFWQFPTGSMGIGPINAIYQARFMRYLEHRGLCADAQRTPASGAFFGDGEMDEPESIAALSLAAREKLDNLTFVINCNLQRLDGPVRGNGRIIQELESLFAGAGWNVIKCLWGSRLGRAVRARPRPRAAARASRRPSTASSRRSAANDGAFNREHFFDQDPELQRARRAPVATRTSIALRRGGHDCRQDLRRLRRRARAPGPADGDPRQDEEGLRHGRRGAGSRMTTHQAKKLDVDALLAFRDRFALPLTDDDVAALRFYKPAGRQRRDALPARAARGARRLAAGARATRRAARRCPPLDALRALRARGRRQGDVARRWRSCACSATC